MCNGSASAEGVPNIVDRSGRRQLPVGIESFEDVLAGFAYVDKTLAVKDLVDRRGVTLYCRPRRFGKSTFLRMLQCFFEAPAEGWVPDRRGLFDGLAVAEGGDPWYMAHNCAHPVIYLNLADCGANSYDQTFNRIALQMADEYNRHYYLMDEGALRGGEVARFARVAEGGARPVELERSLSWLSTLLARHHGAQTVILIDEYDTPVNDAHLGDFRREVLDFYRNWLSAALKGTVDLYCAALTGVLRVSQESIFSELNNVRIDTTLDVDHAEAIGFTAEEAGALAAYVGRGDASEMAEWYDGYRFGGTDVYNPWSVLNYLQTGVAQPYWTNTSRNGIVVDLVRRAGEAQTAELATLAAGGSVAKPLDLRTVFDDLAESPGAVWAQLYQAGYVTTNDTGTPNDDAMPRELHIPNLEVRRLYGRELLARATRLAGSGERLAALHRAVSAADAPATRDALRRILLDSASHHDLTREADYHVLLLALLYAVDGYGPATSDRESGDGRCDVLLEPLPAEAGRLPAHAMELKLCKSAETDDALAACARDVALAQARSLSYGHGLAGAGLVRWGFAFCGKRVAVVCERA
ncbi:MAG: AAA family ATPase [Atopobiaceae bacterium]|nr:AAA family ATPase [Atopobiaceae bacterium]